ncbi:hypothetical protein JTB14_036132 [Gonioctena quinquepunctata]|nr:hypothetical protein JTB14_036132 [Gonioctena quinquepunctata]
MHTSHNGHTPGSTEENGSSKDGKEHSALENLRTALHDEGSLGSRKLGSEETYHIRGMSSHTTKGDIIKAVKNIMGRWDEDCQVREIRPLQNDTLTATLTLLKDLLANITANELVRMGLVRCKLKKRVNVPKCGRCWSFSHSRDECNDPDGTKCCYKCGSTKHHTYLCNALRNTAPFVRNQATKLDQMNARPSKRPSKRPD